MSQAGDDPWRVCDFHLVTGNFGKITQIGRFSSTLASAATEEGDF